MRRLRPISRTPAYLCSLLDLDTKTASDGLKRAQKLKPDPFFTHQGSTLISLGGFDTDLGRVAECDWIIEAVVERLNVKRKLMATVESKMSATAIVSSNTSGIPIADIAEVARSRFVGTGSARTSSTPLMVRTKRSAKAFRLGERAGSRSNRWDSVTIDSRDSAFTNKAQIHEWLEDYGEDSDFFRGAGARTAIGGRATCSSSTPSGTCGVPLPNPTPDILPRKGLACGKGG